MHYPGYIPVKSLIIHGPVFQGPDKRYKVNLTFRLPDREVPYTINLKSKKSVIPAAYELSEHATRQRLEVKLDSDGHVTSTHTW
jgi:hypothetical protein